MEGFETAGCPAQHVCAFEQVDEQAGDVGGAIRDHARRDERVGQLLDPGIERVGRDPSKVLALSIQLEGDRGDRAAAASGGFLHGRADDGEVVREASVDLRSPYYGA